MSDAVKAVKNLVEKATTGGKDWELREAIESVMKAFRPRDAKGTKAALDVLGKGVMGAQGRAAQVLLLALGALVEAGAPPELAWPSIEHKLAPMIVGAGRFAQECVDRTDLVGLDEAVQRESEDVKKDFPRDFAAWQIVRSKCMAANACLTRSPKLREKVRTSTDLLKALRTAETLVDQVDEVRAFSRILRLVHDEPLLVIHPETRKGFRFVMRDLSTNVELYVLLLDALVGDPTKGLLKARRPNAKAVATIKDPDKAPKGDVALDVPFHTVAWTGLHADATLPDPTTSRETERWVWLEGVPADIPAFEGERVILLQGPVMKRDVGVEVPYDALFPTLKLKSRLASAEVDRLLAKMAKAAAKLPPPKPAPLARPKPMSPATKRALAAKKAASKKAASEKAASKKAAPKKAAPKKAASKKAASKKAAPKKAPKKR
jgi:hypothetical protein